MKKLSTSLVAVRKITSNIPRSNFLEEDIEKMAQLCLEAGGLINPIILRRTSFESYEVIDGDFEYYAAVRAREIDLRKGEMIGAFILEAENEEVLLDQVKALRKPKISEAVSSVIPSNPSNNFESRLTNIESRLESRTNELKSEITQFKQIIKEELNEVKQQLPKQMEPLEVFNSLKAVELVTRLRSAGIIGKTAEKIINSIEVERKKKKFESLSDVVTRVDGLSDKKMVSLIDSWSKIIFK